MNSDGFVRTGKIANNEFLFLIQNNSAIIFDVNISIEYVQGFYSNQYLEAYNASFTRNLFLNNELIQIQAIESDWYVDYIKLTAINIKDEVGGIKPSEAGMNITIGGQTYDIIDKSTGEGFIYLTSLNTNLIYSGIINTSQPVNYSIHLEVFWKQVVYFKIQGTVSYEVGVYMQGNVDYDENEECYTQTINSLLLYARPDSFDVVFTVVKDNFGTTGASTTKTLGLKVLYRLTLINGSSYGQDLGDEIYIGDQVNYTFLYTDELTGFKISDLDVRTYDLSIYDSAIKKYVYDRSGTLYVTSDNLYVLDVDTEALEVGTYLLKVELSRYNYEEREASVTLTVLKRYFDSSYGESYSINTRFGSEVSLVISLTDPTNNSVPIINATVRLEIGGVNYYFTQQGAPGEYTYSFPTYLYNTFFSAQIITGTIYIEKENYITYTTQISIVIGMIEVFGFPLFYLILLISAIVAVLGSILGYRWYQLKQIPGFVKKLRALKNDIQTKERITTSYKRNTYEEEILEKLGKEWDEFGVSLADTLNIKEEDKKKTY